MTSFGSDEEQRDCPYCGQKLKRPYWQHIQSEHPQEYAAKETWVQLYKDYKSMGMDDSICLMVIGELFNANPTEIESFLKQKGVL
ncbi:MAG: hypothetical protein ACTSQG_05690 [Promethearchaeota archaeon]